MFAFVFPGHFQVLSPGPLRLLDESMKQDHAPSLVDIEQHSSNSILSQVRPHFIDAIAQRLADGHSDRPAKFDRFNVFANAFAVLGRESLDPITHRLAPRFGPEENRWDSLALALDLFWRRVER